MRHLGIVAAVGIALLLGGCAASPVAVPDVVGMQGDEAKRVLDEAGLKAELHGDSGSVWMAQNWTVDGQTPAAGGDAADGSTVQLDVSKPAEPESTPTPPAPAPTPSRPSDEVTPSGLSVGFAITACDQAGKNASPYGWNADFMLDGTHMVQDGKMFLKAGVDVTNESNAEGRFTVECLVSGTNDAPVIETFDVY